MYETFIKLKMDNAICLDKPNQFLGGDFPNDFAKFVSVKITPCYNTAERTYCCLPAEVNQSFLNLKNLVISLKYERIIYDSRKFVKPITKFISEDNILIDPYIFNFPKYHQYEYSK